MRLQNGEDQILLAQARRPVHIKVPGDLRQLADLFFFEGLEIKAAFLLSSSYLDARFADFYYVITTIIVPGGHPTHNGSSLI